VPEQPRIVLTEGLEWLILPDEGKNRYTNWGDGREGDSSELVQQVNGDPALGLGHSDWRLPTIEELKSLIGNESETKSGCFWSSSQYVRGSGYGGWSVNFSNDNVHVSHRSYLSQVRLVRARQ
jgi:hypothetical protein